MINQQLQHATKSVLESVRTPALPTFKFGRLASPALLVGIAVLDIVATLYISQGGMPWVPAVIAISCLFGYLFGRNDKERLQSLGVAMAATAFTSLGIAVSFQIGYGQMDDGIALALRSYVAIHCGAIILGHALAFSIRKSRVRILRRSL